MKILDLDVVRKTFEEVMHIVLPDDKKITATILSKALIRDEDADLLALRACCVLYFDYMEFVKQIDGKSDLDSLGQFKNFLENKMKKEEKEFKELIAKK
jgi:hypothetical protein